MMHRSLPAVSLTVALAALAAPSANAAEHFVTATPGSKFVPPALTIQVGDTVTWTNGGGGHNVAADDGSFRCSNGCDGTGGNGSVSAAPWSFSLTFNEPGAHRYHCELHGEPGGIGQAGTLVVQAPPGPGTIRFLSPTYQVSEGAGTALVLLQRVGGSQGAVSVGYSSTGGTAEPGVDYSVVAGRLTWQDSDTVNKGFLLPIGNDTAEEPDETVIITLANPGGGAVLGSPSVATVEILDDDGGAPPPPPPEPCVPGDTTLCLNGDRFRVSVDFRTPQGLEGQGMAVPLTADTGHFWFFDPDNVEMLVKVLDACSFADRFWVFAGGLTNVEVDIRVEDTLSGEAQTYQNPLRTPFQPIQDTGAFVTCP